MDYYDNHEEEFLPQEVPIEVSIYSDSELSAGKKYRVKYYSDRDMDIEDILPWDSLYLSRKDQWVDEYLGEGKA